MQIRYLAPRLQYLFKSGLTQFIHEFNVIHLVVGYSQSGVVSRYGLNEIQWLGIEPTALTFLFSPGPRLNNRGYQLHQAYTFRSEPNELNTYQIIRSIT